MILYTYCKATTSCTNKRKKCDERRIELTNSHYQNKSKKEVPRTPVNWECASRLYEDMPIHPHERFGLLGRIENYLEYVLDLQISVRVRSGWGGTRLAAARCGSKCRQTVRACEILTRKANTMFSFFYWAGKRIANSACSENIHLIPPRRGQEQSHMQYLRAL
jgi:hypothetical protein